MNPVILIPARMQATRLPDKPMADIAGSPMIVHVWKRAVEAKIGPVYVACDDARIESAIRKAGGEAVMTRADHPSGSDRIFEALGKIDPGKKYDVIVNVQGDVPTIDPAVIRAVLAPLSDPKTDIATLACEIKDPAERTDPSVVKVVLASIPSLTPGEGQGGGDRASRSDTIPPSLILPRKGGGNVMGALYFSRAAIPTGEGPLYHHIGIYAYRRAALERFVSLPPSTLEKREKLEQLRALEAGMRIGAAIVDTVPLGVDTPEHLEKARRLLAIK